MSRHLGGRGLAAVHWGAAYPAIHLFQLSSSRHIEVARRIRPSEPASITCERGPARRLGSAASSSGETASAWLGSFGRRATRGADKGHRPGPRGNLRRGAMRRARGSCGSAGCLQACNFLAGDLSFASHHGLDPIWPRLVELGELVERLGRRAAPAVEGFFKLGGQRQQRQVMGDRRWSMPIRLAISALFAGIDTRAHEPREIERRQAVAFLVLGHLRVDVMGVRADDDRHFSSPAPRGAQPLGAEEER